MGNQHDQIRPIVFFALAIISASAATGQSLSDLKRLSDAVWAITFTHPDGEEALANAAQISLPQIQIENRTERSIPQNWSGDALELAGLISSYSNLDSIICTTLNSDGINRMRNLVSVYGRDAGGPLPESLRIFAYESFALLTKNAVSLQYCIGAYHPHNDRVYFEAWEKWYDMLEVSFREAGMEISRKPSSSGTYVAGFLSAKSYACKSAICVIFAGPFNVAVPGLNTNQATISTLSVKRR